MPLSTKNYDACTDEELLSHLRHDDMDAFDALYHRHVDMLYRIACKRLGRSAQADDVVQDVFVSLFTHRHQIDIARSVKAWMLICLRNRILNEFRSSLLHATHHARMAEVQQSYSTPDNRFDYHALESRFSETLSQLSDKCREVFELSRFEALPHKSIAVRLGISVSTVEKHIGKALAILKKELISIWIFW